MAKEIKIEPGLSFMDNNAGKIPNDLFEKDHLYNFAVFAAVCSSLRNRAANKTIIVQTPFQFSTTKNDFKIMFAAKRKKHTV
ncbi:hypothetical protein Mpet_2507 [Methanolacinia petrolearia DSM 11571]|uniref:Uncharacterized protein n=1 Tax=Methanolacinia petrolearia (strain DSM 11571 / OCM 486 / SEBR 4847) TaxID=679926 RepID=E1RF07_METP4|nr:hypothetical protein [Methanolacinia petrolearia]ADN37251.1 hypothetical protein Mpet_2507 [Methanolacinia petrolearia DSM 11571]